MNRHLIYLIPLLAAFLVTSADAWEPTVGDLFHVTGCENGTLLVPVVNMWNKPGGLAAGAKVIGKLSGDGRKDLGLQCQGSIVKVLKVKRVSGRTFLKIKSVVNSKIGWITDSFVGRKFDRADCKKHFSDPKHVADCLAE